MVQLNFERSEQQPQGAGDFEPIPGGWYPAHIIESKEVATKKGDGSFINLQLEILGDRYAGRRVFETGL